MSRNAPTYVRQDSYEAPPPLQSYHDASYPQQLPRRTPPGGGQNQARFGNGAGGSSNGNGSSANAGLGRNGNAGGGYGQAPGRSNTVRGAVRGTVREAGSQQLPTKAFVPTRTLTRGKTLTRPDRFVAPTPLINPNAGRAGAGGQTKLVNGVPTLIPRSSFWDPWAFFVYAITCWAPGWILGSCGLKDKSKQRAWKEKVALCSIAVLMGATIAFLTIGLTRVLCPVTAGKGPSVFARLGTIPGVVGIEGWNFNVTDATVTAPNLQNIAQQLSGQDVSFLFDRSAVIPKSCAGKNARYATSNLCTNSPVGPVACAFAAPTPALFTSMGIYNTSQEVGFDWSQVASFKNLMVIDGNVLNMNSYMLANPLPIPNDPVDSAIRFVVVTMDGKGGKDATRIFYNEANLIASVQCLTDRYYAGHIDKITPGCFVSQLFLYFSLVVIMTVVLTRFAMAFVFRWFISHKLVRPPRNLKRSVISPSVMPEGANLDVGNTTGVAPWSSSVNRAQANGGAGAKLRKGAAGGLSPKPHEQGYNVEKARLSGSGADGMISMASIGAELFCVCLVTCYSEGAEGIKITLDSIAATDYSDNRKLLFVVCDGIVTGGGEKHTTPDICIAMIEQDERFGAPQAMSYGSIAEGSKEHNLATVYVGHYTGVKGHRTPTILVVKTGTPAEAKDKKPGNRGKRDSQMILMNFMSRVTYNDRMCPLDYDLFRKMHSLMGVTPDFFEICLMVDADTKVYTDSLGLMVRCMQNDNMIMGLCGETRIANKRQSWVTMIQVFEYFISHHLAKAFESVFGGVTCLPGCFSMYRFKARKANDGDWVPVLISPQIVSEYSQRTVTTLHQKNLLLLGEDRFLTTLLLRTFPNRKMTFCPQARCRTVVPDTFSVLLSQRRRWINSTIHNLMELVLVRDLCGTFCFSMQFVIFIDLIGTVVLPVAICLTYTLIINYIFNPPSSFSDAIPLLLLGAVLGLPAVLILITTFKLVYVGWMLIYLIALPIWNFILPVYAFSKFDDFSWGETRKVEGEVKGDDGHGAGSGVTALEVPLRRWEDWERSRLRKIKRDEKRRKEFQVQFGAKHFHGVASTVGDRFSTYQDSINDGASFMSGDEDRWGAHLGFYSEDGPTQLPPPVGLYHVEESDYGHNEAVQTLGANEMDRVLEEGWGEDDVPMRRQAYNAVVSSDSYPSHSGLPQPPPTLYSLSDTPPSPSSHPFSASSSSFDHHQGNGSFYQQEGGSLLPLVSYDSVGNLAGSSSTHEYAAPYPGAKRRSLGSSPHKPDGTVNEDYYRREVGTPSPSRDRMEYGWDQQSPPSHGADAGASRR